MASTADIIATLNKDLPKNTIITGASIPHIARIPTGIFTFDLSTGGGFPRGKFSIVFGLESSTKSLHAYKAAIWVQKHCLNCRCLKTECKCSAPQHKRAALVDLETIFDPVWGKMIGFDLDDLIVVRADHAEQAVDIVDALMYADDIGIIIVDSVAAMVTTHEVESEAGKVQVAGSSILASKMVKKIGVAMSVQEKKGNYVTVIAINQVRVKIGVMFGDPETTPGGNMLRFASSLTVRLYGKDEMVKEVSTTKPAHKKISAIIRKSKVPIHSKAFEYDVVVIPYGDYGPGDSPCWNYLLGYLKSYGTVAKDGNKGWFCLGQHYKTLDQIKERAHAEEDFMLALQDIVIQRELGASHISELDGDNVGLGIEVDKETGEVLSV